ncbi:MAG TPA: S41 family peptidase, partial [Polyangiaceae bacterium]|nr:S41 family peptidase [Polyangiaceae bacterium]
EDEARERLAEQPGDDNFYASANWFLNQLQDAHVSLGSGARSNPVTAYRVLIDLQSVEGRALVQNLADPSLADLGIAVGDEVVSVDGVAPHDYLDDILDVESLANPLSNQQLIAFVFVRPGFAARLRPQGPTARVVFRRADASEYTRDLIWREVVRDPIRFVQPVAGGTRVRGDSFLFRPGVEAEAGMPEGSLFTLGAPQPFFLTSQTIAAFGIEPVVPSPEALAALELDPAALPDIFAGVYEHSGKKILLLRQPTYAPDDIGLALRYYVALLIDFEGQVDGLVIDQTHNPGGSVAYVSKFFELFGGDAPRKFVQAVNTDRLWIDGFREAASEVDPTLASEGARSFLLRASLVERAYDAGEALTEPMSLTDVSLLQPLGYVWSKPLLVLIDELAASGGDAFPMLLKANGVAPLFGQHTMGAGGSVELLARLPHSNASLSLTRGLFTASRDDGAYVESDFVENVGVAPDIEHALTVEDFRAGFVGYVSHFSDALVAQIEARSPAEPTEPPPAPPSPDPTPH